jgi:predicted esterase
MAILTSRTVRYIGSWLTGRVAVIEEEIILDRDGVHVAATVVRPRYQDGPLPSWVVLHGITRQGRSHQQLVRFTHALAASGLMAIVPEVPEWKELNLAPHLASPTIKAAISGLRDTGEALDAPVGVIGFSFGAPHAIATSGEPELKDQIAGTVGFGGYCCLESTFRFMMSGKYRWQGRRESLRPDPYGRWIAAANYLTAVSGYEDADDVADGLRKLAIRAGASGAEAWDPSHDPVIRMLRAGVDDARQELFDLFAPQSGSAPATPVPGLAEDLAAAAHRLNPLLDPTEALSVVDRPVHLLHGRRDHLIPYTESYRLLSALPERTAARLTVTRLFGHSGQGPFPFSKAVREVPHFTRALSDLLGLV